MTLSLLNDNLDANRVTHLLHNPAWVASDQESITLANFGGNLEASKIKNLPTATPSCVALLQANVGLHDFGGSINSNTQVMNKPATVT